ncbi:MAG: hypothetical protein ACREFU_20690 [Acetobacteraceae bacterium]
MLRPFEGDRYTGTRGWPMFAAPLMGSLPAGHCRRCGVPSGSCRCGCRECRREAKELLVTPATAAGQDAAGAGALDPVAMAMIERTRPAAPAATTEVLQSGKAIGTGTGFIGGGCCASLSVEYAPTSPSVPFIVLVEVADSEGTAMLWLRQETAGTPYRVKECIITTRPGAKLAVLALTCTARVRWCEIFSCGC